MKLVWTVEMVTCAFSSFSKCPFFVSPFWNVPLPPPFVTITWSLKTSSNASCSMKLSPTFNLQLFAVRVTRFNSAYFYKSYFYILLRRKTTRDCSSSHSLFPPHHSTVPLKKPTPSLEHKTVPILIWVEFFVLHEWRFYKLGFTYLHFIYLKKNIMCLQHSSQYHRCWR